MRNILVVSENFNNGGLEKQIKTMYNNMPKDVKMVFAFGNYTEKICIENAKIYTDFSFSYSSTIEQFYTDVIKLVKIIEEENIDVIHVHPYYSIFPALFASVLTGKQLIYTYHGISSLNFNKTYVSSILFYNAIFDELFNTIFAVSQKGVDTIMNLGYKNVLLLPNPVDLNEQKPASPVKNGKWAIISRIDEDKILDIKNMLLNMDDFNINHIDIYGSGLCEEQLKEFILENELTDKASYCGFTNNLYTTLHGKYEGVIGIGRVLIEAMSMGFPTILIGYNEIAGYIDYQIYKLIKHKNFTNLNYYEQTNYDFPLAKDIKLIQKDVRNNYDVKKVNEKYLKQIENCKLKKFHYINLLFYDIEQIVKNNDLKSCFFYKERLIYNLVKKYIGTHNLNIQIDNIISNADMSYELFDTMQNLINKEGVRDGKN